jgi:hypothetical protein
VGGAYLRAHPAGLTPAGALKEPTHAPWLAELHRFSLNLKLPSPSWCNLSRTQTRVYLFPDRSSQTYAQLLTTYTVWLHHKLYTLVCTCVA